MAENRAAGYARALFEIIRAEEQVDRVTDELFRIARNLQSNNDLRQPLTDIALPIEAKEKLLEQVLGNRVSPHTLNVIKFVIGQGRGRELVAIADELARIVEQESQRQIAEVRTAIPLDDAQVKRLEEALGRATGKNVTAKVIVDPSVLGGVFARVGDVVIDGTVSNRLETLKQHLGV